VIVRFEFEELTVVTDTTAILSKISDSLYKMRIRYLINTKISNSSSDTITFNEWTPSGKAIKFIDTIGGSVTEEFWTAFWHIIVLMERNKLQIFDNSDRQIKSIKRRSARRASSATYWVGKVYIDTDTKDKLFYTTKRSRIQNMRGIKSSFVHALRTIDNWFATFL